MIISLVAQLNAMDAEPTCKEASLLHEEKNELTLAQELYDAIHSYDDKKSTIYEGKAKLFIYYQG